MVTKHLIGWSALALFMFATLNLTLLVEARTSGAVILDLQTALVVSGISALMAAILGFFTYTTSPGKVGAIGGLVLFIAVAVMLSFTTIARVEQGSAHTSEVVNEVVLR